MACIAYVDPGNFATNIAGGSKYGYLLLWVLLAANLMAMLIQNLSAKIGIATGKIGKLAGSAGQEIIDNHFGIGVRTGPNGGDPDHCHNTSNDLMHGSRSLNYMVVN